MSEITCTFCDAREAIFYDRANEDLLCRRCAVEIYGYEPRNLERLNKP